MKRLASSLALRGLCCSGGSSRSSETVVLVDDSQGRTTTIDVRETDEVAGTRRGEEN